MPSLLELKKELGKLADKKQAAILAGFFKQALASTEQGIFF